MLEALANEGLIDPEGITDSQFKRAARRIGLAPELDGVPLQLLADIRASHGVASFDAINKHGGVAGEVDGSMFKPDYHIGEDHRVVCEERVAALRALSRDGVTVTLAELTTHWLNMLEASAAHNARFNLSPGAVQYVLISNLATLFALLERDGRVPLASIDALMLHKRIPKCAPLTKLAVLAHFPYILARLSARVATSPRLAWALARRWLAPVHDTFAIARATWHRVVL
jgi:hypothetical protein